MSKQTEMEQIYFSYEWLLMERLEQLDTLARKMFIEMRLFSVPNDLFEPFVQEKIRELFRRIEQKEGELKCRKQSTGENSDKA